MLVCFRLDLPKILSFIWITNKHNIFVIDHLLINHSFCILAFMKGKYFDEIDRSMILKEGQLTPRFDYLKDFAEGK